jgi:hypothetical protein
MHDHRTALWRWLTDHRHEILISTALAATATTLVVVGPLLVALAFAESMAQKGLRRTFVGLVLAAALVRTVVWLWRELRDEPHRRWYPCAQCGRPIEEPSRAAYCSHSCRSYARLERDAQANDPRVADRAQRRLRAIDLRRRAGEDRGWDEVPF